MDEEVQIENVKETKREIIKRQNNEGKDIYELTVVQEYYVENIQNMLSSFKHKTETIKDWLKNYEEKVEQALAGAGEQIDLMKEELLKDLTRTDEEVLAKWREEIKEKQDWLNGYDDNKKKLIDATVKELERHKAHAEKELNITEQTVEIWEKNAV